MAPEFKDPDADIGFYAGCISCHKAVETVEIGGMALAHKAVIRFACVSRSATTFSYWTDITHSPFRSSQKFSISEFRRWYSPNCLRSLE